MRCAPSSWLWSASRSWRRRCWPNSPVRGERLRADCRENKEARLIPALTRRAEEIGQEPDRDDHHRAEQHVGQCPSHPLPRHVLEMLGRESCGSHQFMGGDAEMREDRPDDQRSQQHLDDNTTEVAEHHVPAAEKPLIPRRMTEPMLTRSMLRTIRKPAPE